MRRAARWPLAAVLELAERRDAAAREVLGSALAGEAHVRGERDVAAAALAGQRAGLVDAASRAPPAGPTASALLAGARHVARLREEVGRLAAALGRCEAALACASAEAARRRDAVVAARAEVRALEAHRDAWRADRSRARERAEEAEVEDLDSARARAAR